MKYKLSNQCERLLSSTWPFRSPLPRFDILPCDKVQREYQISNKHEVKSGFCSLSPCTGAEQENYKKGGYRAQGGACREPGEPTARWGFSWFVLLVLYFAKYFTKDAPPMLKSVPQTWQHFQVSSQRQIYEVSHCPPGTHLGG